MATQWITYHFFNSAGELFKVATFGGNAKQRRAASRREAVKLCAVTFKAWKYAKGMHPESGSYSK